MYDHAWGFFWLVYIKAAQPVHGIFKMAEDGWDILLVYCLGELTLFNRKFKFANKVTGNLLAPSDCMIGNLRTVISHTTNSEDGTRVNETTDTHSCHTNPRTHPWPTPDTARLSFLFEPLNIHDVKSRLAFSSQEYFAIVGTNAARSISFASLTFVSGRSLSVWRRSDWPLGPLERSRWPVACAWSKCTWGSHE